MATEHDKNVVHQLAHDFAGMETVVDENIRLSSNTGISDSGALDLPQEEIDAFAKLPVAEVMARAFTARDSFRNPHIDVFTSYRVTKKITPEQKTLMVTFCLTHPECLKGDYDEKSDQIIEVREEEINRSTESSEDVGDRDKEAAA